MAGVLNRLSLAARLHILAFSLILVIAFSNLYLTMVLRQASDTARNADVTVSQIETVEQTRAAFDTLRYWQADLAVSLLMTSERNVESARERLTRHLTALAAFAPEAAAALETETAGFDQIASRAVEAYTADQRIMGNMLFAEARTHSLAVTERLDRLETALAQREREARGVVLRDEVTADRVSTVVVLAAILFGVGLTTLTSRAILGPVRALVATVRRIGAGDMTPAPLTGTRGEFGELAGALHMLRDGLVEKARLEREAEHQRHMIGQAIETISDGFSLYDSRHCLVLCNSYYRSLYAGTAVTLTRGTPFHAILRAAVERGIIAPSDARAEAWIASRLRAGTARDMAGMTWSVESVPGQDASRNAPPGVPRELTGELTGELP